MASKLVAGKPAISIRTLGGLGRLRPAAGQLQYQSASGQDSVGRRRLADLARLPSMPSGLAKRARMVLLDADGMPNAQIARAVGCRGRR
jgi:hypothetical protein